MLCQRQRLLWLLFGSSELGRHQELLVASDQTEYVNSANAAVDVAIVEQEPVPEVELVLALYVKQALHYLEKPEETNSILSCWVLCNVFSVLVAVGCLGVELSLGNREQNEESICHLLNIQPNSFVEALHAGGPCHVQCKRVVLRLKSDLAQLVEGSEKLEEGGSSEQLAELDELPDFVLFVDQQALGLLHVVVYSLSLSFGVELPLCRFIWTRGLLNQQFASNLSSWCKVLVLYIVRLSNYVSLSLEVVATEVESNSVNQVKRHIGLRLEPWSS